jgi:2,4-dienoyl-CoA reductase (NADPH2)
VAVVGAGPAGLSAATEVAARGAEVTLFEANAEIGGQFNLAKRVPGKEEFYETIRYFTRLIEERGVTLKLNTRVSAEALAEAGFDEVIIATGVTPRALKFEGAPEGKVVGYTEALTHSAQLGGRVAIIGAGGVGFDVAEALLSGASSEPSSEPSLPPQADLGAYLKAWGVDLAYQEGSGLVPPSPERPARQLYLLQRSEGKLGKGLGKTTGWIHRAQLKHGGVEMLSGVSYERVDERGLHVTHKGEARLLEVDHVVVCAGQNSERALFDALAERGLKAHLIGGASRAGELDAKRAIREGYLCARSL